MAELFALLTPLALVDSLGAIAPVLAVLAYLLGRSRPFAPSLAFLAGLGVPYYLLGLLAVFGLGEAIDLITDRVVRWFKSPNDLDYVIQVLIGVALLALGWKIQRPAREAPDADEEDHVPAGTALGVGAVMTLAALPSALAYFAAVDQVLKANVGAPGAAVAIL